ncbi:Flp pilus assembly protein CpaB [Angustibacter sp. McL0619]|uniref:Flp pilus assembly protein CpaB n=1 Tax=Angustibacter sp. McL0619 TaxID=3415676 RepID=UPI003CF81985
MNPRQRRGVLLLAVAALGALAVFVSVLSFVSSVNAKAGDFVPVVALANDLKAYQPVTPEDVELRQVPAKWLSTGAIQDARDVVGLVPVNAYAKGTFAERGMFIDRPGIQQGNREVAILVDAETGVAGKVRSGDRVDIIATFKGEDGKQSTSSIWAQNALVIDVGLPEQVERQGDGQAFSEGKAVPVTFALPTQTALRVAYAESFAVKVRLALRARNDDSQVHPGDLIFPAGNGS